TMPPASPRRRWLTTFARLSHLLLALAALVYLQGALALSPQEPVDAGAVTEMVLGRHLMVLVDDSNVLTIDDVRRPEFERRFEPVFVDTPYYGRTHSTYWFRLQLAFSEVGDPRLIEIAYPHLRQITLYQQTNAG